MGREPNDCFKLIPVKGKAGHYTAGNVQDIDPSRMHGLVRSKQVTIGGFLQHVDVFYLDDDPNELWAKAEGD